MKKSYYLLVLCLFVFTSHCFGQILDDDCSVLTPSWTFNNVTQNGGYWLLDDNSDFVISESFGAYDNLVLTSNLRSFGAGTFPECTIEISNDGGTTWVAGTSVVSNIPNAYTNYTYNIGTLNGTDNRIRWRRTNGTRGLRINNIELTGIPIGAASNDSDIIAVASSEAATISSIINDVAPLNSTEGTQVWQFTIRDGGATASDTDNLNTILTDLTLAQAAGNQVTTWTDAIETIALFDGNTFIATGIVTANQIQFSGLNVSVPDDGQTTVSLRLSLQCPLGPDAFDNEDFVFSLSNANTTFSPAGSGKASFPFISSSNGENRIDISATELNFTTEPVNTGVNSPMADVVVSATDNCGNVDTDFNGTVSLSSSGTMTGDPLTGVMSSGTLVFSNIIHTVVDTNRQLTASLPSLTNATSNVFDITNTTTLNPGDLAILAVNTNIGGGSDEVAFVCFQDILPGTTIYMTDNGYERENAGLWGGTEGVISITRTGSTLTAGTIIVFESNNGNTFNGSHFDMYTCGAIDNNWTKDVLPGGSGFNLNQDDDIWIMQGGIWTNTTPNDHEADYTGGNVLYGWTESGWDTVPGGTSQSTAWSTIYPGLECFNTVAPTSPGFVKFSDPNLPVFSSTTNGQLDWIALINDTTNWDTYTDNASYTAGGYDYIGNSTNCPALTIAASGYVNGRWVGRQDTNWFNCTNWDTLVVPDETVDVLVEDVPSNNAAIIDATAPFADLFGGVARTRNLTITGESVDITASINNVLEIYGDLRLNSLSGTLLNMDDGNNGTADGFIYLRGNWINQTNNAFDEGNGTVVFNGTTPQIITYGAPPLPPITTEQFYNLVLDNDFDTSISNDIYTNGNLTINAGATLTVTDGRYAHVDNVVTTNGDFNIENNGSLVQVQDVQNVGAISMTRSVSIRQQDYVYWSSPLLNFNVDDISPGTSAEYIYRWDPTATNPVPGSLGNWINASGETMVEGVGYIVRGDDSFNNTTASNLDAIFNNGRPNNGTISVNISRGNLPAVEDDDWNLVGNPYPSSIEVLDFLNQNTNIEGYVDLWTHGTLPSAIPDPFYEDNGGFNYNANDYIRHNGTGTVSGPGTFNGFIAAGQSFMINMNNGPASVQTIEFNNPMRDLSFDNSQFYRGAPSTYNYDSDNNEHRIWLDLVAEDSDIPKRILVGYVLNATVEEDRLYDAKWIGEENETRLYSLINDNPFIIQGRALPFSDLDIIPLGFNAQISGNFNIAIHAVDGIFSEGNQNIYLKDNLLGTTYNLTVAPYTFTSEAGEFNDRFKIVFRSEALGIDDFDIAPSDLRIVELKDGHVEFRIGNGLNLTEIVILDIVGREVYRLDANSSSEIYELNRLSKAPFIAQVKLSNGQVITKKSIKQR